MGPVLAAAIIMSFPLDGSVVAEGGDYALVTFEVPAGTAAIEIEHHSVSEQNILDWGLWGPAGFRGWGGGLQENTIVGTTAASRGYLPGAIEPGTWTIVIGKAQLRELPAAYTITVTLEDAETLPPEPRADYDPVVLEVGPRWYRGDFHVHSHQSGDASATFDEILTLARMQGLDFVAMTDHNTISQHALWAARQREVEDLLVLRAAEITTYGGHANGFGIADYVDHRVGLAGRTAADIIIDVNAQGGAISINHPVLDLGGLCIGCPWTHADTPWDAVHGLEIHTGNYETVIGLFTNRALELWEARHDAGNRLAALGGSDDHRAGADTGATASPIGAPTTLVYATELSEAAIVDAIRGGRTIVMLRGPGDPMVEVHLVAGTERAMIGDTITAGKVAIETRVTGGGGMQLILYRNGQPDDMVAINGAEFSHSWSRSVQSGGDRFHVEVWDGSLPVTVTSHLYADHAPGDSGCAASDTSSPATALLLLGLVMLLSRLRARPIVSARSAAPGGHSVSSWPSSCLPVSSMCHGSCRLFFDCLDLCSGRCRPNCS